MNGKRDSLMIMHSLIFLDYPVRVQHIGCQIKPPCLHDKVQPIELSPGHHRPDPHSHLCVFLPPNLLYTLDFGGRLSLLFAVNFCRLQRASSP